jgi:hypothetical protein
VFFGGISKNVSTITILAVTNNFKINKVYPT